MQSRDEPFGADGAAAATAAAAAAASQASGLSLNDLLSRNRQVAHANMRHAEQMYVWHTQNIAARETMAVLVRESKTKTQQYRDLAATIIAREKQMQGCLVSGLFPNNEIGRQLNIRFSTLMNQK
jgi:hypothetical protein